MPVSKDQIQEMLGNGLSNEVVATAVGCDPSYITQLMSVEEFSSKVIALRTAALSANSKRDRKIDAVEDKLIDKVEQSVDLLYKPLDLIRAATAVNAMKRRGVSAQDALHVQNTVVNLMIPQVVVMNFTKNSQGEVIEVEGKTLVTMTSQQLLSNLANQVGLDDKSRARYKDAGKYLQSAAVPTLEQKAG